MFSTTNASALSYLMSNDEARKFSLYSVALTQSIYVYDFIFRKQQKYFAKEIQLYIFINDLLLIYDKKVNIRRKIKEKTIN